MPYLMRLCVPHASEFRNTGRNFVCDINDTTWSSSLEILNVFHFIFSWFSIHTPSRDIKSFVRYLHMQRQLYLVTTWECWKEKLYFPLLYYVTQTPQLLLMFGHFCFHVEIQPHFSVNREDRLGRGMICPLNLNVLCNIFKFSVNHYHWVNYRIWEFTTVRMCVPFSTPKKSSVFHQCLQFGRSL